MEESIKNRLILVLLIISIIFFLANIGSCANTGRLKTAHDKEMATRLDLEERMSKFGQEKKGLEEKLKVLAQVQEEEKTAHQATKKLLLQEQLTAQSLKEELARVTKLKEKLEEDLKEELVAAKTKSKK